MKRLVSLLMVFALVFALGGCASSSGQSPQGENHPDSVKIIAEIPYSRIDGFPVTTIGERAFQNCSQLRSVLIPDSVESIAGNAFDGCDDIVIYCAKNSYAEQYATDNGIPFVLTYILGDTDGNRQVMVSDVSAIQRYLAELEDLEEVQLNAADTNRDGTTDIAAADVPCRM